MKSILGPFELLVLYVIEYVIFYLDIQLQVLLLWISLTVRKGELH